MSSNAHEEIIDHRQQKNDEDAVTRSTTEAVSHTPSSNTQVKLSTRRRDEKTPFTPSIKLSFKINDKRPFKTDANRGQNVVTSAQHRRLYAACHENTD